MKFPDDMTEILEGKRYSTAKATLLAGDDYWDGHNFERHGRNTFLAMSPKRAYFLVHLTQWQGEAPRIEPISRDEAMNRWEEMREHNVTYEEAFPGAVVEDA